MKSTRQPKKKEKQSFDETFWLAFKQWWEPTSVDAKTGAEVGGHPHAYRLWVKPNKQREHYGVRCNEAFNCQCYINEYHQWLRDGQPERDPEPTGNCASNQRVNEEMANARAIMGGEYPF